MSTSSKYGFSLPVLWEWGRYGMDLAGRNWKENDTTGLTSLMGWIFLYIIYFPVCLLLSARVWLCWTFFHVG